MRAVPPDWALVAQGDRITYPPFWAFRATIRYCHAPMMDYRGGKCSDVL
jgi:hypothetical protein